MTDEHDYDLAIDDGLDDNPSASRRIIPLMVVAMAISGFGGLAWYAYHAGSNAVNEEDLLLIEADKSPLKETPADPGGMKFPHQDKTIFQAFSGHGDDSAKVERVIPAPEEPMEKPAASASETKTWVNQKLRRTSETIEPEDAKTEQLAGGAAVVVEAKPAEAPPQPRPATPLTPVEADRSARQEHAEKPVAVVEAKPVEAKPAEKAESKEEPKKAAAVSVVVKPAEKPVEKIVPKVEEARPAVKAGGSARIQLGAYKSEAEAKGEWAKIAKRHGDLLSGMSPTVVRVDLGEKGVFYRLQAQGLETAVAAKVLCGKLQAKGQVCILPVGK